ncbi:recombinase family protein [Amycolatopsis sp. MEPSY49]|uniref:recombinase family protein n=1 Tax=Amycolatopsis sp. MEPSY49 TaxID=3151600 RepID=UPI003EF0A906
MAGHSVASIARHFDERGAPCPSSADPDRNRHRTRGAWTLRTVAVILANPRYTGRQTWNRRATDTRGPAATPALSAKAAHLAVVTEQDFIAAQQIRAARPASDGRARRFALAGLIHCGVCDRRLDSHWNHGRATYRCRHGYNSTQCAGQSRPKTLYIREDYLVEEISVRLGEEGNDTPELDRPRHRRVAAALRHSRMIIVSRARAPSHPSRNSLAPRRARAGTAAAPGEIETSQRRGDHSKLWEPRVVAGEKRPLRVGPAAPRRRSSRRRTWRTC